MKFYKIVNPNGHHGMVYKEGINTDALPFNPKGSCEPGGIYFSREDIFAFLNYGTELYEVEPIGEIYKDKETDITKWKAHSVNLKYIGAVLDFIPYLVGQGADITANNNNDNNLLVHNPSLLQKGMECKVFEESYNQSIEIIRSENNEPKNNNLKIENFIIVIHS